MDYARMLAVAIGSMSLLACTRANPAFEDDELGDDASTDESTAAESDDATEAGSSEVGESESDTDTGTGTSDETTTENTTLDTTDTSESTSDTTSETTDTGDSETGMSCSDGLELCDGECVELETDEFNCGGCGHTCADNEVCIGNCLTKKYIFVSSEPTTGAMGGILGADQFCTVLAGDAGLPGTYLAWNSTLGSFPNFDFQKQGAYVRTDEEVVAFSYADLTDGSIDVPINVDESGLVVQFVAPQNNCNVTDAVWSSTTPGGAFAGGDACEDWFSSSNVNLGKVGRANSTDGNWSEVEACNMPCGMLLPIYCVQQAP